MSRNAHPTGGREGSLLRELDEIKLTMKELLDHSRAVQVQMRSQTTAMSVMREEIKYLRKKCDDMGQIISRPPSTDGGIDAKIEHMSKQLGEINTRQKYHQVILKNQRWKFPSPEEGETPYDDDWAKSSLELLIGMIATETEDIRRCKGDGSVLLISDDQSLAANALDYQVTGRAWREFANALREHKFMLNCMHQEGGRPSLTFECLDLSDVFVCGVLSDALQYTHFKTLRLTESGLGKAGFDLAFNYMKCNPILDTIELDRNTSMHREDVDRLCTIIKSHPSIISIDLRSCFGDELSNCGIFSSILTAGQGKLKYLHYTGDAVQPEEIKLVAESLASNPPLEGLHLEENGLDLDEDCTQKLASALKRNTRLRYLSILENGPLSHEGRDVLRLVEFDPSGGLNSAANCNHTCETRLQYPEDASQFNVARCAPALLRAQKIYYVLSKRNRAAANTRFFDEVPLDLLHNMLESIQCYSEYHLDERRKLEVDEEEYPQLPQENDIDVESLSIVYEVMRRWDKVLSLYETLGRTKMQIMPGPKRQRKA